MLGHSALAQLPLSDLVTSTEVAIAGVTGSLAVAASAPGYAASYRLTAQSLTLAGQTIAQLHDFPIGTNSLISILYNPEYDLPYYAPQRFSGQFSGVEKTGDPTVYYEFSNLESPDTEGVDILGQIPSIGHGYGQNTGAIVLTGFAPTYKKKYLIPAGSITASAKIPT